jgi:hypothetical protein
VGTVMTKAVSKALAPQFHRLPWAVSTPFIVATELGEASSGLHQMLIRAALSQCPNSLVVPPAATTS